MKKKLLFIINPVAGKGEIRESQFEIIDRLTRNGFLVTVYPTQKQRDAFEITRQFACEYEYLVCAGGDGTLGEVVDALMHCDPRPVLGYIPCGTTNDYATTLALPKDVFLAVDTIINGYPYPVDVGLFGDRHFTYVAAFGLFTDVAWDTPQDLKNLFGHAAYMLQSVKKLANIKDLHCRITCGDRVFEDRFILGLISNTFSIGGFRMPRSETASLNDGLFEVVLVRQVRNIGDLQTIVARLLGAEPKGDGVIALRASDIHVESDEPDGLKWTLDGEFGGRYHDIDIHNIQQAIRIMVPKESTVHISSLSSIQRQLFEAGQTMYD